MSLETLLPGSRRRRDPLELQLTAMIDIFSMIVIFLIMGTVFGASEIIIPPGLSVPLSRSSEGVESAPRLVISADKVSFSGFSKEYRLDSFRPGSASPEAADLRDRAKAYLARQTKGAGHAVGMVNVIADRNMPYRDLFEVVKVMREAGFGAMLFVAVGEGRNR